jgi:hypothetical protein
MLAVGQIRLDDRPIGKLVFAPDGKGPQRTGSFVEVIVAPHRRQLLILGRAA